MSLTPEERAEVLRTLTALAKENTALARENARAMETICRLLEADSTAPLQDRPTEEEQAILALWEGIEDGAKLSTATVAKLLGDDPTNGSLKRRLADMVRKGRLVNNGSGYALPRDHPHYFAQPNEKEQTVLQALRELGGQAAPAALAAKSGYPCDSNFRTQLSYMVRARMLDKAGEEYVVGPASPPPCAATP